MAFPCGRRIVLLAFAFATIAFGAENSRHQVSSNVEDIQDYTSNGEKGFSDVRSSGGASSGYNTVEQGNGRNVREKKNSFDDVHILAAGTREGLQDREQLAGKKASGTHAKASTGDSSRTMAAIGALLALALVLAIFFKKPAPKKPRKPALPLMPEVEVEAKPEVVPTEPEETISMEVSSLY